MPRLYGFDPGKLTSQHFWDQMDSAGEKDIEKIEDDIIRKVFKKYNLSFSTLFYDTTNFTALLQHKIKDQILQEGGHNKQKRNNLKQFNLALLTTKDFFLPLLHHVYEGQKNDVSTFPDYLEMMLKRLKDIIPQLEDITLVFNKENNSKKVIEKLKEVGYVGSLSIYSHEDLIKVPYDIYHEVELSDGKKVLCYRTKKLLWKRNILS